ncbi:MAG: metal-dependent transcriptional regulator [Candidatus Thermoplasmatota archaeon]
MAQEHIDEYIEAIYDIAGKNGIAKTSEIAKLLHNKPSSVTEVFQRMQQNGLVKYESYRGVSLTKKGLKKALKLKRRHRLLEVFLYKNLKIPVEKVHDQACKMEHTLSEETENALCRHLGGPTECPHGSPIPLCDLDVKNCYECINQKKDIEDIEKRKTKIVNMASLKPGQKARISFIHGGRNVVQRLCDLGLTSGTMISIVRSAPFNGPMEICVRGCKIVIGKGIATKIFVELEDLK